MQQLQNLRLLERYRIRSVYYSTDPRDHRLLKKDLTTKNLQHIVHSRQDRVHIVENHLIYRMPKLLRIPSSRCHEADMQASKQHTRPSHVSLKCHAHASHPTSHSLFSDIIHPTPSSPNFQFLAYLPTAASTLCLTSPTLSATPCPTLCTLASFPPMWK